MLKISKKAIVFRPIVIDIGDRIACEYSCFSLLLVTKVILPGGLSTTQQQKCDTDDVNQCLPNKPGSHGVSNTNLFDFMFLQVDYGKSFVIFSQTSFSKTQMLFVKKNIF